MSINPANFTISEGGFRYEALLYDGDVTTAVVTGYFTTDTSDPQSMADADGVRRSVQHVSASQIATGQPHEGWSLEELNVWPMVRASQLAS